MIRPVKLNPAPRVDPKANAAQISQLEAQAAKLREQIRLANKMGEREWAATARQELEQVNGQLSSLQAQAATPVMDASAPANGVAATNGTSANPAVYTQTSAPAFAPVKLTTGATDKDNAADQTAREIVKDVEKGKSIDKIAADRGMKPEEVIAAIGAGKNLKVTDTAPTRDNDNVRTTQITDTSNPDSHRTVTLYQSKEHDTSFASVQEGSAEPTKSPVRDSQGRTQTTSQNPDTGAATTRYEDDLGNGTVTERTVLPNGTTVETVTPKGGPSIPKVTVTGPDGKKTELGASQRPGGATTQGIQKDLADGKSIDQIAQDRHLSKDQVIAELQAAGYQVTNTEPPRGNGVQTVELNNPHTKEKTVYVHNRQSGERKVVTTKGDVETTVGRDGNGNTTNITRNIKTNEKTEIVVDGKTGTEVKTVTDKDGRVTKTTTEKINDGKPVDYEVKPDDNLTWIAQQHGVTLDELKRTNPELFEKRNPNLINPGEKVRIENGTRTTVEVTANGYTLTTDPEGKVTLKNNATGVSFKIEAGTGQHALAELLVSINPSSSDPETAKTDKVVKTALEGIFGGASPELLKEVEDKKGAVAAALQKYGPGRPVSLKLDGSTISVGPFGDPPKEPTKSGGQWQVAMVNGKWQWFDPEITKAIAAENEAVSRLGDAQAKASQAQAQLDVYALDPEYKDGAFINAKNKLNKTLAPYGLQLKAPEATGTLEQAKERLALADAAAKSASTARNEYAQAQKDILTATDKQKTLRQINDPKAPAAGTMGGPSAEQINLETRADHAEVNNLFISAASHTALGNKATVDQMISATELQMKLIGEADPRYKGFKDQLTSLKGLQSAAAGQVTLIEAYQQLGTAQKEFYDLSSRLQPVKDQLIGLAYQRNPHHFDEKGYTNGDNEATGKLISQKFVEENGQLYMVNTYENDVFLDENNNDTKVLKVALTFSLDNKNIREDFRNTSLNKQWQEIMASSRQTPSGAPVCASGGTGSYSAIEKAKENLIDVQIDQGNAALQDIKGKLAEAQTALDKALEDHKGGTVEVPAGTLQPGEQPVQISVNGRDLWVAPEVAAAYHEVGPSAIGDSGKAVQIVMGGQKLWVHPDVAGAEIDRSTAQEQKEQLEKWNADVRPVMEAGRDWLEFSARHPKVMLDEGMGERQSKLKYKFFQEERNNALAGYQVQFEKLYGAGFKGEYANYKSEGDLKEIVGGILGASSEEVDDVVDEITDQVGDNADVRLVPIFALDGGMESQTALFQIKKDGKDRGYVDSAGKHYDSFDEFQHENRIFSENSKLVMAKSGDMSLGADGKFTLEDLDIVDGRKVNAGDKAVDIGLGITAGVFTIVSFIPGQQWAIPIAVGAGAALGTKTLASEIEHWSQGGEFDEQSFWNVTTAGVSFLPVGAGALRTFGLAKASLPMAQAFKGGFGLSRLNDSSMSIGQFRVNFPKSSYADKVSDFLQGGSKLNGTAWGFDAAGVVFGAPLLMKSAEDLALHGGEMSFAELANAIVGLGTGIVGTGIGGRSLLHNIPGGTGPRGAADGATPGDVPPPVPPADGTGSAPRQRHVYEAGEDGVYRPTGKFVTPDPNEVVIQGEVVSESTTRYGAQDGSTEGTKPTGPRELPPAEAEGTGRQPAGEGEPSTPPIVHAVDGDGAEQPTPIVMLAAPPRKAIEGPSTDIHEDGAPAPGERGDPEGVSDSRGRDVREQNTRKPADNDPIVVGQPRAGVTSDPLGGGPLLWDPLNKKFVGISQQQDTSAYSYSSGKDQELSYTQGARTSDPAVQVTPDEILVQSETETRDGLNRETTGRQGPSGVKPQATETSNTPPLMRYTVGTREGGQVFVDFNQPLGSRVVAVPEPKAIGPASKPTAEPLEITDGRPVLFFGEDGNWSTDPATRKNPSETTDTGHPRSVRDDGTPIVDSFSSSPYSLGQTYKAFKAGLRRAGTRYLGLGPRYDYPKLGELVDSIYHRPVPKEGFKAGQKIYVEVDGEYVSATVIIAGPQANSTRGPAVPGVHATESGYLGDGSTVERAKRVSITTPNGQLRVNTPAEEVHTYNPKDNAEVKNRSALGETLAGTMPVPPADASAPARTWTSEQAKLVRDYLESVERSSDPVVRDTVTRARVQLGGEGGMPKAGSEMTPAQYHSLLELLAADKDSMFTGSKPEGTLSANGLTTLEVFSAQGKMPVEPGTVAQKLGLAAGESLTAGALPGEAQWTQAGRGIVGDYLKAAASSTDPVLAGAAQAAAPLFKGRGTKPGKAVTPEQQAALMKVLEADKNSTWVYGPKLQPDSTYSPAGKLSPEGRYNGQVLSGHETWTPYLWRQIQKYAANQQNSADPAVQALARSLENALPGEKPRTGTEINSEVPDLLAKLLEADKASSWRAPSFFTDAQGVWRADRATVSWYIQEHEANVWGGSEVDGVVNNAIGLGGSALGVKVPLPSKQVYGELSLKNNGTDDDGTGFILPLHPNDTLGHELFNQGYRPNFAHDESTGGWVASAPMLSKNTYQSESAFGVTFSIAGVSVSGSYVKRSLLYLGAEGGRPGYTYREAGPLSKRAAEFWEEALRGGGSHYSSEGKVPGFEDRLLFRNFDVLPPFGGGKEPWRSSPAFEGVPRETGAGPLNRLNRNDGGIGFAVGYKFVPLTTMELGTVNKAVVPHERTARAHPDSSQGAQKVFNALAESGGRLTPEVLQHLDTYLVEVLTSPNENFRNAGLRLLMVMPELGVAPPLDPYATSSGRPEGMGPAAWKAVRQQLDQQARGELTPTQAHYLNQLLGQDVLNNAAPPPDGGGQPAPQGPDGPVLPNPDGRPALPPAPEGGTQPRMPAPQSKPGTDNGRAWGASSAKPLSQADITANQQEASALLGDMLPQSIGMREVTKAGLADQFARSPTLMDLLRGAHANNVRIVNPARNELRIFDPGLKTDLTGVGSQYDGSVQVVFVDAETFRTSGADSDTVLAEFVDLLGHELQHANERPIDLQPQDFDNAAAYREAYVGEHMKSEGEATFVQYAAADELAANGGNPASLLRADWNAETADVFARYNAGEITRTQAINEMAKLHHAKSPSTSEGTYGQYYGGHADTIYRNYQASHGIERLKSGAHVLAVGGGNPIPANAGNVRVTSLSPHGRGIAALRPGRTFDRILVGNEVIPGDAPADQMMVPLSALSDKLKPGGQIHLDGTGDPTALREAVDQIPDLTLTHAASDSAPYFRLTKVDPGQANPPASPAAVRGGQPSAPAPANNRGRTIELTDKDGHVIVAAMLGTEPRGPEHVYIPPVDGPRQAADAPETAGKTHILLYDSNSGEPVVVPWYRGGSEDHVPGSSRQEGGQPIQPQGDPTHVARGNVGPYVFRADTRTPAEIRAAQGFSPQPPTGIWVNNTQGISLSNYVLGNTHGRFVGTSRSISGAKSFVAEESRAAREQGHTYLYVLNPNSPRLHVPTEFEAIGRPVGERMARVDEIAVDGNVPWSEVYGWRMMDADGSFVGEFTPNPDFIDPGTVAPKRPQLILRTADEFWDAGAPAEVAGTPVNETNTSQALPAANKAPVVATAADTPSSSTWPPALFGGRAIVDPVSGRIVSLELPPSYAVEPGHAGPVSAPTGKQVNGLSPEQISGLTVAQLHAIRPEHIGKLTPEQVSALTPQQIAHLTLDQLAALKPKQLRVLSAEQLQAIRPSRLEVIAPGRFTAFKPEQLAAFSPEQLAALTIEQARKLTPDQIAKLSDEQRNAFTAEQFTAFRPAQFSHLSPSQVVTFKPELADTRNLPVTGKLSPEDIAKLTREQLGALSVQQIEALTQKQVLALTPEQLGQLSAGQLRKFTPEQFAWMTTDQTNALSVAQLTIYRSTHKDAMTTEQAAGLAAALSYARFVENRNLLAAFGSLTGTSYGYWQAMPPHLAPYFSAGAFTIRGVIFTVQSVFPKATANHTTLGRWFNGISGGSYVFSSPGTTVPTLEGTGPWANFVANSTYAVGNVIYGPKGVVQGLAGRPVFRIAGDHIGNFAFVVGSAAYAYHTWGSPYAAPAGVAFALGSAEFWASAIRADRLNRKPVPRTPEEIKAREKSDKRWSIADRLALGLAFGAGMLVFAWDTVDELLLGSDKGPSTDPVKPVDNPGVDGTPPDEGTDKPVPEPTEPPEALPQLVVLADDGLNLRTDPDGNSTVVTILQPGSFVEQTDKPSTDGAGKVWLPVEGRGPDGDMHKGWVAADLVRSHPDGSSSADGRTNPKLEQNGYRWVEVKDGESIRLIATANSADVADTVVLNMDHILSPDVIFAGDRIYLPAIAVG